MRYGWPATSGCRTIWAPYVKAYWDRLQAREGYQRALAAESRAGGGFTERRTLGARLSQHVIPGDARASNPRIGRSSDAQLRICGSLRIAPK